MKALAKLLLVTIGSVAPALAQEPSATPNSVDEPDLPSSKPGIPRPPSTGLLPESGALPNPTSSLTPPIYSPLKTKNPPVSASTVKPPLRPKAKTQKRFEEVRSIAMRSSHVVNLLKRANNASTGSARRNLMRAYYLAVCARMRLLEPGLENSINAYQAEKTGKSATLSDSKIDSAKVHGSQKRSHRSKGIGTRTTHHKHAYSHRASYPNEYGP
jgi:hypothetical protein